MRCGFANRLICLGVTLLFSLAAWSQPDASAAGGPGTAASSSASAAEAGPSSADASPNAMTRTAVQRGILQCAARVEQVTRFTGFGPQAGGLMLAPSNPPDQRLFSMLLEVPAGAAVNSLVSMNFAPNQANGCGATYESVSYWAQPCDAVANKQFSNLKRLQPLKRDVAVLDGGPATKVFLMRAGDNGCVSIKKEIVL